MALSAALLSLAVYLITIYPGLFGLGDAAMFAFVGKILGTPHAPGYPLYVMVSHLFSYIPLGTLAYRMNVLSALLGAVAVFYSAGRVLGCERPVALATSLALGFGHAFWSKALYAKGYTLNAALVAGGLLYLLKWGQSRERRHLYTAIGIFALSSAQSPDRDRARPGAAALRHRHRPAYRVLAAHAPRHRRDGGGRAVDLGVTPVRAAVRATVDLNNPKRATVCGVSPSPGSGYFAAT